MNKLTDVETTTNVSGALMDLEQATTNFILAILPKLTALPKDAFEELLSALTSARIVLGLLPSDEQEENGNDS